MPVALAQPGVYIEEISSGVRTITGVATSIALFIGWAPRGLTDRAVRIASFPDYERAFGGLDRRTPLGHAVKQFFDNGGSDAYIVRLTGAGAGAASVAISDLTVNASSPGLWAGGYNIRITGRPAPDAARFKLEVLDTTNNSAVVESFENLSMDNADPRFTESVINDRSNFITVSITGTGTPADNGPAGITLGGGADGTVIAPGTPDFHAALTSTSVFGLGSITDRIDIFNLVCVPGETDPTTIQTLQAQCQIRRAFLLVDSPKDETVANMPAALTNLTNSDAPNSAIFYPWVRAPDPLQQGALTNFPPCGFVAGIFARTDSSRGVWKAPAGSEATLSGATGLAITMSDAENGQLNPHAASTACARCRSTATWCGARARCTATTTAARSGSTFRCGAWRCSWRRASTAARNGWCSSPTTSRCGRRSGSTSAPSCRVCSARALSRARTPRQAYFVKCDSETTTQADINLGVVNILVGFAPLKPAEFVVIKIQQIAGDIADLRR